jgi:hypothetical protein
VDSIYSHHMAKDASKEKEENIFVAYDYALNIFGSGIIECEHGVIIDVYHVPQPSINC